MGRFKVENSSLIPLGHLKAKVCKVVGGKENIVGKDNN